jgi:hypothetical protein
MAKKLLAAAVVAVVLLGAAPASANRVTYTERHCDKFLMDETKKRHHDMWIQVHYLAKDYAIQPERGDARRFLRGRTADQRRALFHDCWELVLG